MKKIIFYLLISCPAICLSQLNIVPMPADVKTSAGSFIIGDKTIILAATLQEQEAAKMLNQALSKTAGFTLPVKEKPTAGENYISFSTLNGQGNLSNEGYDLEVTNNHINIAAKTQAGSFYAIQTFIQLLQPASGKNADNTDQLSIKKLSVNSFSIPQLSIKDYPRFSYRGMHVDVARHFEPVSFIKKYIDYLATYKFNTFHWHLTDDQGWRIEIKKYPKLTQVGGYRNGTIIGRYPGKGNDSIYYGGFYTQEEVKEVVQYAAERFVDVIPEIEMPGHASAAIAAYPELSCFPDEDTKILATTPWAGSRKGKQVQQTWGIFEDVFTPTDYTFKFLEDVLDEVMPLFPSKYIHIGGDECPKEAWKKSAFCRQLIKDSSLKDEHGLQSYFIHRIEKYINSKGKKIIGWDEILEGGLAPNAAVMSWRGEEGGIEAAKQNHDVVMTPGAYCYFDKSQSKNEDSVTIGGYLPLEKVYGYEPVPAVLTAEQAKHVLGAQANLWTEYIKNGSKVEYMIFPRMIALSEVLWSPKEKRNWKDFEKRLPAVLDRLDKKKVNYSKAYYDLQATVMPAADKAGILWHLESKLENATISISRKSKLKEKITVPFYDSNGNRIGTKLSDEASEFISLLDFEKKDVPILEDGIFEAKMFLHDKNSKKYIQTLTQKFSFNKATGKKISLLNEPSKNYPGDGAFTLVNGVQNEQGLSRGNEFLGFLGKDCEGQIDFGKPEKMKTIRFHSLNQNGSWIYPPKYVEVSFGSAATGKKVVAVVKPVQEKQGNIIYEIKLDDEVTVSSLNFKIVNFGIIPEGSPGAGTAAWLFVDEIEVL